MSLFQRPCQLVGLPPKLPQISEKISAKIVSKERLVSYLCSFLAVDYQIAMPLPPLDSALVGKSIKRREREQRAKKEEQRRFIFSPIKIKTDRGGVTSSLMHSKSLSKTVFIPLYMICLYVYNACWNVGSIILNSHQHFCEVEGSLIWYQAT